MGRSPRPARARCQVRFSTEMKPALGHMLNGGDHAPYSGLPSRVSIDSIPLSPGGRLAPCALRRSGSRRCRTLRAVAARSRDTSLRSRRVTLEIWSADVARAAMSVGRTAPSSISLAGPRPRAQAETRSTVASSAQCRSSNTQATSATCAVIDASASLISRNMRSRAGAEDLSLQHVALFAPDQGRKLDQPGGRGRAQRLNHQLGRRPAGQVSQRLQHWIVGVPRPRQPSMH